jgi:hypothetical protein
MAGGRCHNRDQRIRKVKASETPGESKVPMEKEILCGYHAAVSADARPLMREVSSVQSHDRFSPGPVSTFSFLDREGLYFHKSLT